jgi:lipopolysaccharide transport system ATP-binding protein
VDANLAIVTEHLTKEFRLGATRTALRTLRDFSSRPGRARLEETRRVIKAVDDVSFEVGKGEAIGIIGANGAGKSTLLKLLSRITPPTSGTAMLRGRVGSLLEVGTGFHPELTGRENVYMNGAILGMSRGEIERKFDEIVAFAGVERFLDTPVKRYSSGMYVRLAFAVAANLDADILLVDEVLSVGDYGFQRRCLGKMQEQTSTEGRTVLFVSHNLGAIKALTQRCIWLDRGSIRAFGSTDEVFRMYLHSYQESGAGIDDLSNLEAGRASNHDYDQDIFFESLRLEDGSGRSTDTFPERDPVRVVVYMRAQRPLAAIRLQITCAITSLEGVVVFTAASEPELLDVRGGALYETSFAIEPNPLAAGDFRVHLRLLTMSDVRSEQAQDHVSSSITLHIEENPDADSRYARTPDHGLILVDYRWNEITSADALAPLAE